MPGGYVAICPSCGRAWQGIPLSTRGDWYPLRVSCAGCPDWLAWVRNFPSPPGSIAAAFSDEEFSTLPPEVIRREFQLYLNQLAKEIANEQASQAAGVT